MNSCLYQCNIMHERLSPRQHRFDYRIFMFYVDLDELTLLDKRLKLFGINRFNWFTFRDRDHLPWSPPNDQTGASLKENVKLYLKAQGVDGEIDRIMLLTNVATMGYSFNPISFYLCFDKTDEPVCSVAEVSNTHGEMKLYVIDRTSLREGTFRTMVSKYFYVSPFAELDSTFEFIFKIPSNKVHLRVDDYQQGKRFLLSSLTGVKKELTDANLFWYGIKFPLIPLKIITLIYWQAFVLYLKRVPFRRKNFKLHLQKEIYHYK